MKIAKKYLYATTIILAITGIALYLFSESIFSMPTDFQSTRDQRAEFYPESYTMSGSFSVSWEAVSEDYWYVYFTETTSHNYNLKFDLKKNGDSQVDVVFKSLTTDNNGYYSFYEFDLYVKNLQGTTLGSVIDFSGSTTVTVPELSGYKFVIDGVYVYVGITGSYSYDILYRSIDHTSTLDLNPTIWERNQEALGELMPTIAFSVIVAFFAVEYGVNFTSRNKKHKIMMGVTLGASVGVFIYGMVGIGLASSGDYFTGYKAPLWFMIGGLVIHLGNAIYEERTSKSTRPRPAYQPTSYSQPTYQQPIYRPQTTIQETPSTNETFIPKFCTNCGSKLDSEAKFCTNCGSGLG